MAGGLSCNTLNHEHPLCALQPLVHILLQDYKTLTAVLQPWGQPPPQGQHCWQQVPAQGQPAAVPRLQLAQLQQAQRALPSAAEWRAAGPPAHAAFTASRGVSPACVPPTIR